MNWFDSSMLRFEALLVKVEKILTYAGIPVADYLRITHRALQLALVFYVIALAAPPFLTPPYGSMTAGLCLIICAFFFAVFKARYTALVVVAELGSGFLPDAVRRDVGFFNSGKDVTVVDGRKITEVDVKQMMWAHAFRGLATAGLWIMAPLLVPITFDASANAAAYVSAVAVMVMLAYTVAADWEFSGWATKRLREVLGVLLIYNLTWMLFPGWNHLILGLGALAAYLTLARNKFEPEVKPWIDGIVGLLLVILLWGAFSPGSQSRFFGWFANKDNIQSVEGANAKELETIRQHELDSVLDKMRKHKEKQLKGDALTPDEKTDLAKLEKRAEELRNWTVGQEDAKTSGLTDDEKKTLAELEDKKAKGEVLPQDDENTFAALKEKANQAVSTAVGAVTKPGGWQVTIPTPTRQTLPAPPDYNSTFAIYAAFVAAGVLLIAFAMARGEK